MSSYIDKLFSEYRLILILHGRNDSKLVDSIEKSERNMEYIDLIFLTYVDPGNSYENILEKIKISHDSIFISTAVSFGHIRTLSQVFQFTECFVAESIKGA